jgi:hypothetical protein
VEAETNQDVVEKMVQERYHEWILRQFRTIRCPFCGTVMYEPTPFIIPGGADRSHPSQWRKDYDHNV